MRGKARAQALQWSRLRLQKHRYDEASSYNKPQAFHAFWALKFSGTKVISRMMLQFVRASHQKLFTETATQMSSIPELQRNAFSSLVEQLKFHFKLTQRFKTSVAVITFTCYLPFSESFLPPFAAFMADLLLSILFEADLNSLRKKVETLR